MKNPSTIIERLDIRDAGSAGAEKLPDEPRNSPSPEPKKSLEAPDTGEFDAIIIGGGPAGMTAGIYLARKLVRTLLITTDLGGQVLWTSAVENYPGYHVISGWDLANSIRGQLEYQPIFLRIHDTVTEVFPDTGGGGRVVTERGGDYRFRSLLIATGKHARKLDIPGEREFRGRGVSYCSICDAPLFRGEAVAVIGGGNSALTAANDLLELGCEVHLLNPIPGLQADGVLLDRAIATGRIHIHTDCEIEAITGDDTVRSIRFFLRKTAEEREIPVTGVFISSGLIPNSGFAQDAVALDDGEIIVNCFCETSAPGIFAAGDVTTVPDKQIIIAAGEGAKAALGAAEYLRDIGSGVPGHERSNIASWES